MNKVISLIAAATTTTSITISKSDLGLGDNAPTKVDDTTIATILGAVYLIAGIIAVIVIIIGGIRYTTSNGDSGNVKSAKDTILYAVVGLIVIIMASAITTFVVNNIG